MDLTPLLRQTVSWAAKTGTNARSEATFAAPTNIQARVVPKYRDLILPTGEAITTAEQVMTLVAPSIGDKLNGRQVIQVDGLVGTDGTTVGYSSLTR